MLFMVLFMTSLLRTFGFKEIISHLTGIKNLNIVKKSYVISRKQNVTFSQNEFNQFMKTDNYYKNLKQIRLTPGGLSGYYNLGTCVFLKDNYDLSNYYFTGASAGAWNSLGLAYKSDINMFAKHLLNSIQIQGQPQSIYNTQLLLKKKLLNDYTSDDFDLKRIFMGVTHIKNKNIFTNIYTDFKDLEDAIDCAIASSNIPFLTGICNLKYNGHLCLDGGFSVKPYIDDNYELEISPKMWEIDLNKKNEDMYNLLFYNNNLNIHELFLNGYHDAIKYKYKLDEIFNRSDDENIYIEAGELDV